MATKEMATRSAKSLMRRPGQQETPYYIYRVGAAWMFTTESEVVTQSKYKVPVREFQEIFRDSIVRVALSTRYGLVHEELVNVKDHPTAMTAKVINYLGQMYLYVGFTGTTATYERVESNQIFDLK